MDALGRMYALNAVTGEVLWDYAPGANCLGGAAIVNGMVYWGAGYDLFAIPPLNDVSGTLQGLYAFGLPD